MGTTPHTCVELDESLCGAVGEGPGDGARDLAQHARLAKLHLDVPQLISK
jgi:hypothetical protein